jgi:Sulfotransferase family
MFDNCRFSPVVVIGAPRSGTTLLAAVMNAHTRLSCGNETHFFEDLREAVVEFITDRRHWPRRAFDYMSTLQHAGRRLFDLYGIDPTAYHRRLSAARPAVSTVLCCFMESYLEKTGKARWIEKTPNHLKVFTRIRRHFPGSPAICIFRDPRDVALSLMKVPWGPSTFADGLLIWKSYFEYYCKFILSDKNVLTIRFEDLVEYPSVTCSCICKFINEDYDASMLNTSQSAAEVGSILEPYKGNTSKPIDQSRASAWKAVLNPDELAVADVFLNREVLCFGYPVSGGNDSETSLGSLSDAQRAALAFLNRGVVDAERI